VTFSVNDDTSVENTEAFVFALTGSSDSTQLIRVGTLVGQISDNDVATNGDDVIATGNGVDVINALDGNDTIHAGNGADVIDAGAGDDEIYTGGGMDQITAGSGDDQIFLGPIDWAANSDLQWHLDGGEGFDVLLFDGFSQGQTIDLDALVAQQQVLGIEMLHITGGGNNTLQLSGAALLSQSVGVVPEASAEAASLHQLLVVGDSSSSLALVDSGWVQETGVLQYDGYDFSVYTHDTMQAQVLVQQGIIII
jgi:Ca2+-binding RTX toxin-like protein